jgi:hypothetical protein
MHGSPYQNLKTITSDNGRFCGKIFATFDKQKAARYMGGFESGGNSWIKINNFLFVLNTNPENLLKQSGSIYEIPFEGFEPDYHKGKKHDWIYSKNGSCHVLSETKYRSVLKIWDKLDIVAIPRQLSKEFLESKNSERERLIKNNISLQKNLVGKSD